MQMAQACSRMSFLSRLHVATNNAQMKPIRTRISILSSEHFKLVEGKNVRCVVASYNLATWLALVMTF